MQLKVEDGILTAAVRTPESRAFYSVLNGIQTQGGVGLFTNKSTGAFRELRIDRVPRSIRSSWD